MYYDKSMRLGADDLLERIAMASPEQRLELQPELSRVIDRMQRSGEPVPTRLRNLNAQLCDEAIEARFDNLPV